MASSIPDPIRRLAAFIHSTLLPCHTAALNGNFVHLPSNNIIAPICDWLETEFGCFCIATPTTRCPNPHYFFHTVFQGDAADRLSDITRVPIMLFVAAALRSDNPFFIHQLNQALSDLKSDPYFHKPYPPIDIVRMYHGKKQVPSDMLSVVHASDLRAALLSAGLLWSSPHHTPWDNICAFLDYKLGGRKHSRQHPTILWFDFWNRLDDTMAHTSIPQNLWIVFIATALWLPKTNPIILVPELKSAGIISLHYNTEKNRAFSILANSLALPPHTDKSVWVLYQSSLIFPDPRIQPPHPVLSPCEHHTIQQTLHSRQVASALQRIHFPLHLLISFFHINSFAYPEIMYFLRRIIHM